MSIIGYLEEIAELKKKVDELTEQIESERKEHRDIYMKLKNNNDNAYIARLKEDVIDLRAENQRLILRNNTLEEELSKGIP
jgi:chromosome segregation ATPase